MSITFLMGALIPCAIYKLNYRKNQKRLCTWRGMLRCMATASFDGIRTKLDRAVQLRDDFHTESARYFKSNPYGIQRRDNPETGECTFYLTQVPDIPPRLVAIIGDALHNLRSALDHLAWQLVIKAGNIPTNVTAFPICDSAKHHQHESRKRLKGMSQNAIDAIDNLKPYKGGGDPDNLLWCLHRLNAIDKHRLLVTTGTRLTAHSMSPSQRARIIKNFYGSYPRDHFAPDLSKTLIAPSRVVQFPLKAGDELVSLPIPELERVMSFNFAVAFREPGTMDGVPVDEALFRMRALVGAIALDFYSLK
jgi:hypothetical protein